MVQRGKQAAAMAAIALVEDGMTLGLGTGSTMSFALEALAVRIENEGLKLAGVPTSEATAAVARRLHIPLTELPPGPASLDLAIDGADEVATGSLDLIKGLGGALLREKLVASSAARLLILVDESKIVDRLGATAPVPVEVEPFGHAATADRLRRLGARPVLRRSEAGEPVVTDGGNLVYDCHDLGPIGDPAAMEQRIKLITGVVDSGLFVGMTDMVIVGAEDGSTRRLVRQS